jgi:hypothetical protein
MHNQKLEYLLKLYSRELCSTIDAYKNGKNAYIYSSKFAQQRRARTSKAWHPFSQTRTKSFVRRHLNSAWLLQGGTCAQGYHGLIAPGLPYLPFMARAEVSSTCLIFINCFLREWPRRYAQELRHFASRGWEGASPYSSKSRCAKRR